MPRMRSWHGILHQNALPCILQAKGAGRPQIPVPWEIAVVSQGRHSPNDTNTGHQLRASQLQRAHHLKES